ncbi:MAG: hypothetical protein AB1560_11570 [Pseudomonadota bacterium]
MPYYAIYQTTSGALVAIASQVTEPLPAGLAAKFIGAEAPDTDAYQWDPSTLGLVSRAPPRLLAKHLFIARFTDQEQRELFGFSLDTTKTELQRKRVAAFIWLLTFLDVINLDAGNVMAGVNYLETAGILAAGRAAQILS